ncbi:calcium-binding protein [Pseudomonas sp. R1-1]|uniref:calcium-binding protein n=1 Tax=Pseudomonas sp. R1-1 TaxID=1602529 RepID=UPI003DA861DA
MSKLITPSLAALEARALGMEQISASANPFGRQPARLTAPPSATAADPDAPYRRTLASLDKHFGPLRIGEVMTSRVELQALGATVHGQPISPANAGMQSVDQAFLDGLNFDAEKVHARLRSADIADSGAPAMLFFEICCKRSPDAGELFVRAGTIESGSSFERLNRLGRSAQKLDIQRVDAFENSPGWVSRGKSYLLSGAGVGMQAFGIYSGYMAMVDAIKHGETGEAWLQGGSIAAELGSLIVEQGFSKGGQAMIRNGGMIFRYFPRTSVGKFLSRGAGMFASILTLPFDIKDAVKSFNAAAATSGKVAQDHYVSGGLSVAGAGISLALGVAALAGFGSVAGPLGLAAAGVLIAASMIYQAARVVDDIDDYIELTAHERLRSGWFAFTGKELDKEVMDRFKVSKGYRDHQDQLQLSARQMLEGAYKHSLEHVVNGAFRVELKSVELWRYQWNEQAGEQPFKLDSHAAVIDGDDEIDAGKGLPADLEGKVSGTAGDGKGVFWRLGDGNDRVIGVDDQPNMFSFRAGHKALTGGAKSDAFYHEVTHDELNRASKPAHLNVFDGGAGSDTLAFEGSRPLDDTAHFGHDINLQTGKISLRGLDVDIGAVHVAQLTSIENVSTLRKGTSRVTGSDEANRIAANGYDRVNAGAGDDTIAIGGIDCRVNGGSGMDRYYIADTCARTTIIEDGEHASLIEFGWPRDVIQHWEINDTSLVVRSLRGVDGSDPEHVLTIENVYQRIDGERQLKNAKLVFKTQDEYELLALLPTKPGEALIERVDVAITIIGKPSPTAEIISSGTVDINDLGRKRHYVSRLPGDIEFVAKRHATRTSRVVHLDFKSIEIKDVVVSHEVEIRKGVSGNTHLTYKDIDLALHLPDKTVTFKGVIQPIAAATGYSGRNSLKVTTPLLAQDIVLILQDEVSYRLQVPELNYQDDARNPGPRSQSTRSCLKRRTGNYLFTRPLAGEKLALPAHPSKVVIPAGPHTGIHVLHGQSSTYDVYLTSNSIVRLSTPGAAAKTANASVWNIFTSAMTETIKRDDIDLDTNRLRIGSAVIELPTVDDDAPVESVSVVTSAGHIYEVSLLFEVLQLYVIDASAYASVAALLVDLDAHRLRNELAASVHATHLCAKGKTGTLVYRSTKQHWSLGADPKVRIEPEDLLITPTPTA